MTYTKDNYCSFRICRLLQEVDFDGEFHYYYTPDGYRVDPETLSQCEYKCPSHAVVMKWLFENYDCFISIQRSYNGITKKWRYYCNYGGFLTKMHDKPEDAVDEALVDCLTLVRQVKEDE